MFKKIALLISIIVLFSSWVGATEIADPEKRLWNAARDNNMQAVKDALKDGATGNFLLPKLETEIGLHLYHLRQHTALMIAVEKGNEDIVKVLLENDVDINIQGQGQAKETALMIAVRKGNFRMMNLLLDSGARVSIEESSGRTALTLALKQREKHAALLLLNKAPDIDEVAKNGGEALFLAGVYGYFEVVKELLKHGTDPTIKYGWALLPKVIKSGYHEIARLLIEKGRNPNNSDWGQDTALIVAARYGYLDLAKLLIENNADINKKGEGGNTALISAAQKKRLKITKLLLEKKADVNIQNRDGETALIAATQIGSAEIVELLLEKKAGVNIQNRNGETALMTAAQIGSAEIVKLLINNNTDINVQNRRGKTALMAAAQGGSAEIVKLLIEINADVNAKPKNSHPAYISALFAALKNNHLEIAEFLIQNGADVNIVDHGSGATPLIVACLSKPKSESLKLRVVNLLIEKGADVNFKKINERSQTIEQTALTAALANSNYEIIKLLIQYGADVNLTIHGCCSPLMILSSMEPDEVNLHIAQLLLRNGADVHQQMECDKNNGKGSTSLIIASAEGHFRTVKLLLERKAEVNVRSECFKRKSFYFAYQETFALSAALKNQHYKIAELLIKYGADVNSIDYEGYTPLTIASKNEKSDANFKIIKLLLDKGAEISVKDKNSKSPLFYAISEKNIRVVKLILQHNVGIGAAEFLHAVQIEDNAELVELLLQNGADPNSTSEIDNRTAVMNASSYGNTDTINLLIKYGATGINAQDRHGRTALMMAASRDHLVAVKMLIDNGADHNIKNNEGKSVWTQHNSQDIISLLQWLKNQGKNPFEDLIWGIRFHDRVLIENSVKKGVDINKIWGEKNTTPLGLASYLGHTDIVRLLIKNGANVNTEIHVDARYQYYTPLMLASDRGDTDIAKLLIEHGADVNALFPNGATALHFAVGGGHIDIVKLLINSGANTQVQVTKGIFTGMTPLIYAGERRETEIYNILKNAGKKTNEETVDRVKQLLRAAHSSDLKSVKEILQQGIGVDSTVNDGDFSGATALMVASGEGYAEIVKYLIEKGSDVNAQAKSSRHAGITPLMLASSAGHVDIVRLLLEKGATADYEIDRGEMKGESAMSFAHRQNHTDIVALLENGGSIIDDSLEDPPYIAKRKIAATKQKMKMIGMSLSILDSLPKGAKVMEVNRIEDLVSTTPQKDDWGTPIMFQSDKNTYQLISYGSDKAPGGENFSADIFMWPDLSFSDLKSTGADEKPYTSSSNTEKTDKSSVRTVITASGIDLLSVFRRLENAGFNPGPYQENDFSSLSDAVRRFQKFAKLEVSGIIDTSTWAKLKILYDPGASADKK